MNLEFSFGSTGARFASPGFFEKHRRPLYGERIARAGYKKRRMTDQNRKECGYDLKRWEATRKQLKIKSRREGLYLLRFLKWMVIAAVSGGIIGLAGAGFHWALGEVTSLRQQQPWLLYLLPVAGLLIVFLYQKAGMESKGTDLVLQAVRSEDSVPFRMAPLIAVSTLLTHLCGGSAGREGAALQLGGSLGQQIGRFLRLDDRDQRIITMCGMGACFAALFGTPVTAAVFAMEVVSVGIMQYSALVPCALASFLGAEISRLLGQEATSFTVLAFPAQNWASLGQCIVLGVACAFVAMLFYGGMHAMGKVYGRFFKNGYLRVLAGSGLIWLFTFLLQTRDYLGAGTDVIARAMAGDVRPEAFLMKILFTAVTLGAGFKGGEIVPALFIGATFGGAFGHLLGMDVSFAASVGMVCVFCGATNSPLASLLLAMELFGGGSMPLYLVAVAVSYCHSGYGGLYAKQKMVYSKFRMGKFDRQDL